MILPELEELLNLPKYPLIGQHSVALNALTCFQDDASLMLQASHVAICIELLTDIEVAIVKNEPRV